MTQSRQIIIALKRHILNELSKKIGVEHLFEKQHLLDGQNLKMRILTWNINGIRSLAAVGSWKTALNTVNADIVCLQETKVTSKYFIE